MLLTFKSSNVMPFCISLNRFEKLCQLLSCLLFISIPITSVFLLMNLNTSVSRLLTLILSIIICLLVFFILIIALIRVFSKTSQESQDNEENSANNFKKSAIASLVTSSAVANGQLMVQYRLTDLEIQLNSLNKAN